MSESEKLRVPQSKFSVGEIQFAYLAILATLVILAFVPILLRLGENSLSPNATIFGRSWSATAILGFWVGGLFLKRRSQPDSPPLQLLPDWRGFLLLLAVAILFVSFQLLWAWSLTQTTVANSEVMHSLTPLFTTLVGWSLFGQKFDRVFLIGMAIAISGAIVLAANDFSIALEKLQGDGLALLSALFWGSSFLIIERLRLAMSILTITIWNCGMGTLLLFPILLVNSDPLWPHTWGGWIVAILLGLSSALNQSLIAYSLKHLSLGLVATILLLNPLLTAILAWFIFSETLTWLNWLALLIILSGIYLTTLSKRAVKAQ